MRFKRWRAAANQHEQVGSCKEYTDPKCRRVLQSAPTLHRSDFGNFLNAQAKLTAAQILLVYSARACDARVWSTQETKT
jgi:hypothetical protein